MGGGVFNSVWAAAGLAALAADLGGVGTGPGPADLGTAFTSWGWLGMAGGDGPDLDVAFTS